MIGVSLLFYRSANGIVFLWNQWQCLIYYAMSIRRRKRKKNIKDNKKEGYIVFWWAECIFFFIISRVIITPEITQAINIWEKHILCKFVRPIHILLFFFRKSYKTKSLSVQFPMFFLSYFNKTFWKLLDVSMWVDLSTLLGKVFQNCDGWKN